ncbi:hypothetical protein HRI_004675000 [Hibiscus trionum]|uniref:NAD-dependent epimerase/dehydratase domain-containing protein n=1 Tax=Hibiscus trionum TaxID=183268 RepID=A0A9W7MM43_HIBTR|nr:hypothetical protein HRI_004675000 [Hibiscus trionum]
MATYKPRNILIIGDAGFIGCHVTNRLVRNYPEYKIAVLDKLDYCSNLKNLNPSKSSPNKFVEGDIGTCNVTGQIRRFIHVSTDEVYKKQRRMQLWEIMRLPNFSRRIRTPRQKPVLKCLLCRHVNFEKSNGLKLPNNISNL